MLILVRLSRVVALEACSSASRVCRWPPESGRARSVAEPARRCSAFCVLGPSRHPPWTEWGRPTVPEIRAWHVLRASYTNFETSAASKPNNFPSSAQADTCLRCSHSHWEVRSTWLGPTRIEWEAHRRGRAGSRSAETECSVRARDGPSGAVAAARIHGSHSAWRKRHHSGCAGGHSFSVNLNGANLFASNLEEARVRGADSSMAVLEEAKLPSSCQFNFATRES